jgi:hypothetical protein
MAIVSLVQSKKLKATSNSRFGKRIATAFCKKFVASGATTTSNTTWGIHPAHAAKGTNITSKA